VLHTALADSVPATATVNKPTTPTAALPPPVTHAPILPKPAEKPS